MLTLQALWSSYAFTIGGLAGASKLLSDALNDDAQKQLGGWLKQHVAREPETLIQSANKGFLFTFDWLFASRGTAIEGALWSALIISPLLMILVRFAFLVSGVDLGDATDLLSMALCLTLVLAISLVTISLKSTAARAESRRAAQVIARASTMS